MVDVEKVTDYGVGDQRQYESQQDAHQAGHETYYQGFGVENIADVALAGAQGPQDADLFAPLEHGNICHNTDHDRRDDQRDRDESHQDTRNAVHYNGDGTHQGADEIGVGDNFVVLAAGRHTVVIAVQNTENLILGREIFGINADAGRRRRIGITQLAEVGIKRIGLVVHHRHQQRGELAGIHVERKNLAEPGRVDAQSRRQLAGHLVHRGLQSDLQLGLQRCHHGLQHRLHGLLHVICQSTHQLLFDRICVDSLCQTGGKSGLHPRLGEPFRKRSHHVVGTGRQIRR